MTKAEKERLIKLSEECSETIQIIMKILQYGYDEHYPKDPDDNRQRLENEIRDIFFWLQMMHEQDDINLDRIIDRKDSKKEKAARYTQYQDWSTWRPE